MRSPTRCRSGKVAGAALDVLPKEPADAAHPLIRAWRDREPWLDGRLVLTPHAAFYSPASLIDLRRKSVEVVVTYLRDGRLTNCVNQEFLTRAPAQRDVGWAKRSDAHADLPSQRRETRVGTLRFAHPTHAAYAPHIMYPAVQPPSMVRQWPLM